MKQTNERILWRKPVAQLDYELSRYLRDISKLLDPLSYLNPLPKNCVEKERWAKTWVFSLSIDDVSHKWVPFFECYQVLWIFQEKLK
jgi:hypothetical protein